MLPQRVHLERNGNGEVPSPKGLFAFGFIIYHGAASLSANAVPSPNSNSTDCTPGAATNLELAGSNSVPDCFDAVRGLCRVDHTKPPIRCLPHIRMLARVPPPPVLFVLEEEQVFVLTLISVHWFATALEALLQRISAKPALLMRAGPT